MQTLLVVKFMNHIAIVTSVKIVMIFFPTISFSPGCTARIKFTVTMVADLALDNGRLVYM